MTHNVRTQSDGTWTTGNYVTLPPDWQDLNRKVFSSVNGDKGGCWNPTAPIILTGLVGSHLKVAAKTVVAYGGQLKTAAGARFNVVGADTWPLLAAGHVGRKRDILHSLYGFETKERKYWKQIMGLSGTTALLSGIQSPFCSYQAPGGVIFAPNFYIPLRVHDGARIVSATWRFRVLFPRAKKPVIMPRFRIVRSDSENNLVPLRSVAGGATVDGYMSPAVPDSGELWFNGGAAQGFTYTCDQNNIIDTSQYSYFAQLIEETGAVTALPNSQIDGYAIVERKSDVRLASIVNQAITGAVTVDGTAVVTGDRILYTGQTIPQQNGIWIANTGGAWTRAGDLSSSADFTPNFIVAVSAGGASLNSIWQISEPQAPQPATVAADNSGSPIRFLRVGRAPSVVFAATTPSSPLRGNLYHSVLLSMDSIVDMRPQ